jgi:hypothetical protein
MYKSPDFSANVVISGTKDSSKREAIFPKLLAACSLNY